MNEKNDRETGEEKSLSKDRKKIAIIIFSIIAAVILLLIILPKAFQNSAQDEQPTDLEQDNPSSATDATPGDVQTPTDAPATGTTAPQTTEESTPDSSVPVQSGTVQKTGYEPLDTLTSKILSNIAYEGMSSNAKLKAIYSYVKNNMTYNMYPPAAEGLYDELMALGYSDYDSSQMTLAYNAATYLQGVCDNYAALTMVLARAAGIPLQQCGGLSASGSSHAWNTLMVDGEKYLVDTNYGIYMKRFSQSGYTEQMDGSSYFNNFKTSAPSAEEQKISWMFNAGFGSQRFMGNSRGEVTQTAAINRPLYPPPKAAYPAPITPTVTTEGAYNTFSATVSAGGAVIETLQAQSGDNQMYYFSWYPPGTGSYVIEITASSDGIFTGHFIIYAEITD